jgi:hemolysin III
MSGVVGGVGGGGVPGAVPGLGSSVLGSAAMIGQSLGRPGVFRGRNVPAMRGWLHLVMAPIALVAGFVMVALAPTVGGRLAAAVYTLCAVALFGGSAVYHIGRWSTPVKARLQRMDHANVFLLVAGTYTPVALGTLKPPVGPILLAAVWTLALGGVAARLIWRDAPKWLWVPLYITLGWVAAVVAPSLVRGGGLLVFVLVALGGVMYTAGAIIFALKRPNPRPAVFGYHEVFHALTVAAFLTQHVAVWIVLHS